MRRFCRICRGGWDLVDGFRIPDDEVKVSAPWRTNASTVAATISHTLRRFAEQSNLTIPEETVTVTVGGGVNAGTVDFAGNTVLDSAASGKTLSIGGAFFPCSANPASSSDCRDACVLDQDCAGGQLCARDGNANEACNGADCFCAWPDQGTMKFVTSHELGHVMQDVLTGGIRISGSYAFECADDGSGSCATDMGRLDDSPFSRFPNQLVDPPHMHEVCGCQHVQAANALHCMQSIERVSRADSEGFAHFFGAMTWNKDSGSCRFNYYKEFLDVDQGCRVTGDPEACSKYPLANPGPSDPAKADVTFPPVSIDCTEEHQWRDRHECGLTQVSGIEELEVNELGTELDWMTFLTGVYREKGMDHLIQIYNRACHPIEPPGANLRCGDGNRERSGQVGLSIGWVDSDCNNWRERDCEDGSGPAVQLHGGILSGAEREFGPGSPEALRVEELGRNHGVAHK